MRALIAAILSLPAAVSAGPCVTDQPGLGGCRGIGVVQTDDGPANALQAVSLADTRRVDFVMIGDSNQLLSGHGFDHGFCKALGDRFGFYSTAIYGTNPNPYNSAGYNISSAVFGATTGASATQQGYDIVPQTYGYVADAATYASNNGVYISATSGVNVNSSLRMHYAYSTFATGTGSFKVGVRRNESPWTVLGTGAVVSTNTGAEDYVIGTFDLAAATRNYPLNFGWYIPGNQSIAGPFLGYFARVEDTAKANGLACHTFYANGGYSLYDMAAALNALDIGKMGNYFAEVRRLQVSQGLAPMVVIYINSGLNDRNEASTPSLGPAAVADPDSAEAYADNLTAIVERIEAVWDAEGWDRSELFWLIVPSHPVSSPDDAELVAYRAAAQEWVRAKPRANLIDFTSLTDADEMLAQGWYASAGADTNHLTQTGYETLAARVIGLVP